MQEGVRQGGPLSPLLFVLATDLLQSVVNKAYAQGLLRHTLNNDFGQDYLIVQYADNTLIILPAYAYRLFLVKGLLRSFTDSTCLKVNFNKSFLVPINIASDKADHLAKTIACSVASMPVTYLGLPLGTTRPSVEEFFPLVSKIERRMMALSKLLSYQGRIILVNLFSLHSQHFICVF
jgi:hypothetical protein